MGGFFLRDFFCWGFIDWIYNFFFVARDTFREFFESRDFWSFPLETRRKLIEEVFELSHKKIIEKYSELTVIKWEGHRFQLENIRVNFRRGRRERKRKTNVEKGENKEVKPKYENHTFVTISF